MRVWPGDTGHRQDCLCLPLPRTDGWGPSVGGADESFPWKAHVNKHPRLPWWAQWVPPPLLHPAGMRLEENEVMSVVGAPGLAVRVNWPGAQGTMCLCLDPGSLYSLRSFGGHREVKGILSTYPANKSTSALQAGTSLWAALGSSEHLTFSSRLSCLP